MVSEDEPSSSEVRDEGINMKEEVKEEAKRVKGKGRGRRGRKKKEEAATTTVEAKESVPVKRLLRRLDRHESTLQELSSSIKLLRSKRFMKKIDSIETLIKEVKALDRRLRRVEKIIGKK